MYFYLSNGNSFYLLPLLYFILSTSAAQSQSPYIPTEKIFLNSGSTSIKTQGLDGRNWDSDANSKFCPTNSDISIASTASTRNPIVLGEPYFSARIILSQFTCIFPVSIGPKFVRLYFYPATYLGHNPRDSFFSVTANGYTLLSNFSAYLTSANNANDLHIYKEFIVTVGSSQRLNLTFTPSPNSFAFINGIEVVSMPTNLYFKNIDYRYPSINQNEIGFYFDNTTSLERVTRLNVGGSTVGGEDDTGMFRTWFDDTDYIFADKSGTPHQWRSDVKINYTEATPAYVAPEVVYITKRTMGNNYTINLNYNLTWVFSVDSGFNYLVRLHFCETEERITEQGDRVFFIYINDMIAESDADVISWSGGRTNPVYKEYTVWVPPGSKSKQELFLALHPNTDAKFLDAILNGIEIFKLNKSDGSLAGSNPELIAVPQSPEQPSRETEKKRSKASSLTVPLVGAGVGSVLCLSLVILFFLYRRKAKPKDAATTTNKSYWFQSLYTCGSTINDTALLLPTDLCYRFTMAEIRAATRNFNTENAIGSGGFGTVYKGFIENGSIPVAIKRLAVSSRQGIHEFQTEIKMLSRLRHAHLVSLIGYCNEQSEMILVYEFMLHGNLQDHLYKNQDTPLPWKQRLQICIGAARGLHYLHSGAKRTIIHRDVKTSNILLDSNWVAKVSDFGLSKTGPASESQTHVSTVVKGSFGYLDPQYCRMQQLTEKSDVYSFGVVLLEVVCGRPPMMPKQPKEQVSLVEWTRNCLRRGTIEQIIDPQLKGDIARVSLNKFLEIAESCVRDKAAERPTIGDVAWGLEFVLELQQTAEENGKDGFDLCETQKATSDPCKVVNTTDEDESFTSSDVPMLGSMNTVSTDERSYSNNESDRVKPEDVFSEIMNKHGR